MEKREEGASAVPAVVQLPIGTLAGLEPLLTIDELCVWTRYSRSVLQRARLQEVDPLPTIGTVGSPRFLPSEVLAWMHRENARAHVA